MSKTYAGIGARKTPTKVLTRMQGIASFLSGIEYELYSGGADGADRAFEAGCDKVNGRKKIFLPWDSFNDYFSIHHNFVRPLEHSEYREEARKIANHHHFSFSGLSEPIQNLMTRNVFQVLGEDLQSPVDFVVCWTARAKGGGGTGQALRIAKTHNIPIFDLCDGTAARRLADFLKERGEA